MHQRLLWIQSLLLLTITGWQCQSNQSEATLQPGMTIAASTLFHADSVVWAQTDSLMPAITIEGENLFIDFNHCMITGTHDPDRPDLFKGTALIIKGKNITIQNLHIRGFKIAIYAENVKGLHISNCDLSYNYRQKLGSTRTQEDLDDWLYYHHNEKDEWLRYGAAIYLKNCDQAELHDIRVTQGQNGIMMTECDSSLVYNNDIRFNSGIGLGLYRSNHNRILHNLLDFNVRGYSHGIYQRGQDSAGLLVYEQSSHNVFAYNSATHSGDGFFLWAGQTTMDSGEGGCNDNLIYRNDFSYAPTNGIEVTFSRNWLVENTMIECKYGIWGGYSFENTILSNRISQCSIGLAIEHGHDNILINNTIDSCKEGIKLWERAEQPTDWGFAQNNDVSSRDYLIAGNSFADTGNPFAISNTNNVSLRRNQVDGKMIGKDVDFEFDSLADVLDRAKPIPNGQSTSLTDFPRGRRFILINEWGPYNFEYPSIWLREIKDDQYIFAIFGPEGNWRMTYAKGFEYASLKTGGFPTTLTCRRSNQVEATPEIELEFIGAAFTDQFGKHNPRGIPYNFHFRGG